MKFSYCSYDARKCGSPQRLLISDFRRQFIYTSPEFLDDDICAYQLSSEHLFQFDIVTEVKINSINGATMFILAGESQSNLNRIIKLTSTEGVSSSTELRIEDGETYFLVVIPDNPGVKTQIPGLSFSIINKTGMTTREFAYNKGQLFVGCLIVLCIFTIVMSNFAIQNEVGIIEPPDENLFKEQMKSYRQIGNVWDPEDEKRMI